MASISPMLRLRIGGSCAATHSAEKRCCESDDGRHLTITKHGPIDCRIYSVMDEAAKQTIRALPYGLYVVTVARAARTTA